MGSGNVPEDGPRAGYMPGSSTRTGMPSLAPAGEEYLDSLLNECLGRTAGCPDGAGMSAGYSGSEDKAMGDGRGIISVHADESRKIQTDAGKQAENVCKPAAEEIQYIPAGEAGHSREEFPESGESPETGEAGIAPRRDVRTLRTHGLFFEADAEGRDFASVLKEVQTYLSKEYSSLVTAEGSGDARAQIRRFAGKYIQDHRISVPGMDTETLISAIYSEMAEFGFLTKYIYGEGIEEIDINAWDDVEVQFAGGVTEKLAEHFDSPEHAVNVVRRMLHVSGMVLDDASPSVLGHLSKNIRIAVLKTPIVDEDVGVAASIRIVNPQSMKKQDFIKGGTATGQMLDFLNWFPWTITISLMTSLAIAMIFIPMLEHTLIKKGLKNGQKTDGKKRFNLLDTVQAVYEKVLEWTFRYPKTTLFIGVLSVLLAVVIMMRIPQRMMPEADRDQFAIEIYLPQGSSLDKTAAVCDSVYALLKDD